MDDSKNSSKSAFDTIFEMGLRGIVLFVALMGGLAVCIGIQDILAGPRFRNDSHRNVSSTVGFPKTLTPIDGKTVTIPTFPIRIVAANCGAADMLSEMIDIKRLAAIPYQVEDYAADPKFWHDHPGIPRFEKFNAERILGFRPDLVISSAFQDGTAATLIEQQHVPILNLNDFETLNGIRESIALVGEAVGAQDQAKMMTRRFDATLSEVAAALKDTPPVTVVIYSNFGVGYTVGSGVGQDDIVTRAGGINLAAKSGMKGNAQISFEQLLRLDPDYILVTGDDGLDSPQAKLVLNEPSLKELRAVKNRKLVVVKQRFFDALSQYATQAVFDIARQLHPGAKL
ncbi:MAG: ABC transporter substrate-binding protein [Planctomycetota bacterium]